MNVTVENLIRKYGSQKAVNNISFKVNTGEILGFLGPNGAGKTTTMRVITTFITPTEGDVHIGNYSIKEDYNEVRKHIGYLPENNPLYQDMAIIDYLEFVAELQGVEKSKIKDRILEMIRVCGLESEKYKKINELSKGYKQRVGLAQALIHDPDVLILDEPTSGLDPNQIIEIRKLIKKIGQEKTVILCSHILAEVEATCDRILIINKGEIVANGTAEELKKRSQGREILKVTIEGGEKNKVFEALRKVDSVEMVDFINNKTCSYEVQSKPEMSSAKNIFNLCVKNGWFLTELTPIETKLEDVFHELTTSN